MIPFNSTKPSWCSAERTFPSVSGAYIPRRRSSCSTKPPQNRVSSAHNGKRSSRHAASRAHVTLRVRPVLLEEEESARVCSVNDGQLRVGDASFFPAPNRLILSSNDPDQQAQPANQLSTLHKEVGRPILESLFDGCSCCLLSYGSSNSGKSYVLEGTCGVAGSAAKLDDIGRRYRGGSRV